MRKKQVKIKKKGKIFENFEKFSKVSPKFNKNRPKRRV